MKKVNLFGCTTAEKLVALEKAYDEIVNNALMFAEFKGDYSVDTVYAYGNIVKNQIKNSPHTLGSYIYINENEAQGVTLDNEQYWFLLAANGEKGDDGAEGKRGLTGTGISHITMGTPYISGQQTITPLKFLYTDDTMQDFAIYAQNGKNGSGTSMYNHDITLRFVSSGSSLDAKLELISSESEAYTADTLPDKIYNLTLLGQPIIEGISEFPTNYSLLQCQLRYEINAWQVELLTCSVSEDSFTVLSTSRIKLNGELNTFNDNVTPA